MDADASALSLLRSVARMLSTHVWPYVAAVVTPFLSWSSLLGLAAFLVGYYRAGRGAAPPADARRDGAGGARAAAHHVDSYRAADDGVQTAGSQVQWKPLSRAHPSPAAACNPRRVLRSRRGPFRGCTPPVTARLGLGFRGEPASRDDELRMKLRPSAKRQQRVRRRHTA